jgi:flagellar biosynthesis protein FlhF
MKVKTLTGPTIQAALTEARKTFGDDVVLLESIPPEGNRPARVIVMTDVPAPRREEDSLRTSIMAVSPTLREAHHRHEEAVPEAVGRRTLHRTQPAAPVFALEDASAPAEGFSGARRGYAAFTQDMRGAAAPVKDVAKEETPRQPRRRGNLYPSPQQTQAPAVLENLPTTESLVEAQLRMLNDRMKHLEGCFGESMIGASLLWASHPLFSKLIEQGMRPATAARLFDRVASRGHTPDSDLEMLRWALAQEIRSYVNIDAPKAESGTLVLIGPAGSGKTSLALKLAKHSSFYGRRRTTVIIIQPEPEDTMAYQSPIELYRRFGVPVQSVRTQDDMAQALERVQRFDQVIIDTPSLPSSEQEARKMLLNVRRLTEPVLPLQVQFVVNTTRVLDRLNAQFLKGLPVRPDSVALTHLDDTDGWGRIAEWISLLSLPVRYASTGPRVPDNVVAFSPSWFVEEMMQL